MWLFLGIGDGSSQQKMMQPWHSFEEHKKGINDLPQQQQHHNKHLVSHPHLVSDLERKPYGTNDVYTQTGNVKCVIHLINRARLF